MLQKGGEVGYKIRIEEVNHDFSNDSGVLEEHNSSEKKSVRDGNIISENICKRVKFEVEDREIVHIAEEVEDMEGVPSSFSFGTSFRYIYTHK